MFERVDDNMFVVDGRNDNRYSACVDDLTDVGITQRGVDAFMISRNTDQRSELSFGKRAVDRFEVRL